MQWIENSIEDNLFVNFCVAIKILRYHYDNNEDANNKIVHEIQLNQQMSLYYNNIARLYGITKEGARKTFSLVMEYANDGGNV
ncbi:hypothetical protein RhiirA4_480423 [Rhizophagus irregularis]|uniref:Protein kinase domain-containing protein n=1 Tax=Rhizophagus irregularis TaxID=588596 RepID=A0A2I1GB74_9GLOM|nr:hypothetical protein RhiirA4_457975 [Rhizophagus irregularis]PKY58479.1 hypothetical protein RhiirA4_480423 [Rhizophagus irregularis]